MKLQIKYAPIILTRRRKTIFNFEHKMTTNKKFWGFSIENGLSRLIERLFFDILLRFIPFIVVFLQGGCSFYELIKSILLYTYIYIIYTIFYEIGYLHNDFQSSKKENNPKIRIEENPGIKFYIRGTIIRIITGLLLMIPLYFFNPVICISLFLIIVITQIIYLFHNLIRNYFYNWITFFVLRFLKMSIFILPLYYLVGTFSIDIYIYTILVFMVDFCTASLYKFSDRPGYNMPDALLKTIGSFRCGYNFLCFFTIFMVSKNILFLCYSIIFILLFFLITPKKIFKFYNDR